MNVKRVLEDFFFASKVAYHLIYRIFKIIQIPDIKLCRIAKSIVSSMAKHLSLQNMKMTHSHTLYCSTDN